MFLEISQNSQENTCACNFIKKGTDTGVFLWILRNFSEQLFYRTHPGDCFWTLRLNYLNNIRSSPSEVFLGEDALKLYSKITGQHPCRCAISIKLHLQHPSITSIRNYKDPDKSFFFFTYYKRYDFKRDCQAQPKLIITNWIYFY